MRETKLTEIKGFEEPVAANLNPEWAKVIRRQRQDILDELRGNALPSEVAGLQATDGFPTFRALVWKNQQPVKKRPRRRASFTLQQNLIGTPVRDRSLSRGQYVLDAGFEVSAVIFPHLLGDPYKKADEQMERSITEVVPLLG